MKCIEVMQNSNLCTKMIELKHECIKVMQNSNFRYQNDRVEIWGTKVLIDYILRYCLWLFPFYFDEIKKKQSCTNKQCIDKSL